MAAKGSKYIVAFDPGERTGFVAFTVDQSFDPETGNGLRVVDQGVLTVRQVARQLSEILAPADVVTYETWRLYATHAQEMIGNDMQPSQVVGMIRYEAWKQKKKVVSHGADIKGVAWKTMPQWLRDHMDLSSEQHDKDAIMHGWYIVWRHHHTGAYGG
jgi:hypothetical protein